MVRKSDFIKKYKLGYNIRSDSASGVFAHISPAVFDQEDEENAIVRIII